MVPVIKAAKVIPDSELWIYRGERYDLRSFVDNHPGGSHAILLGQGRDCTQLFDSYHPFTDVPRKVLARYKYVGSSEPIEASLFKVDVTPFYDDARSAARKLFSPRGNESSDEVQRNCKATAAAWVQHTLGMCVVSFAFWRWCHGDILAVFYFPVVYWMVCSDLMHNGSHFAMSRNVCLNTLSAYIGGLHVQFHLWAFQHVVAHHVHTNVHGKDPDMHHFDAEADRKDGGHMGYRSHPSHPNYSQYKWCWKYGIFHQMMGTTAAVALLNVAKYVHAMKIQVVSMPRKMMTSVVIDRAILTAFIALFCWYKGVGVGLSLIFPSWCVHGCLFNIFSQITHVNEQSFPASSKGKGEPIEWAVHQVLTGADYNCDSKLWGMLSINLNNQIVHHLFPSVHPCHYPALRRALIPVCEKHKIDYLGRSSHTFVDMLCGYYGWISKLNSGTNAKDWMQSNIYGLGYSLIVVGIMFVLPMWTLSNA